MNFDSQSQIHFFDPHTLIFRLFRIIIQNNIRRNILKSPAGYQTGHFPEMRADTGPELLSGAPLLKSISRFFLHLYNPRLSTFSVIHVTIFSRRVTK